MTACLLEEGNKDGYEMDGVKDSLDLVRKSRHVLSFRQNWSEIVSARSLHRNHSFWERNLKARLFSVFFGRLGSCYRMLFFSLHCNAEEIHRIES